MGICRGDDLDSVTLAVCDLLFCVAKGLFLDDVPGDLRPERGFLNQFIGGCVENVPGIAENFEQMCGTFHSDTGGHLEGDILESHDKRTNSGNKGNYFYGNNDEKARKSIEATEEFFHDMGLKTRLSDYGIHESDLDTLVEPIDRMGWKLGEHGNIDSRVAKEILLLRL